MWFDTTDTSLLVYYTDSDGAQWVDMSGATGPTGATGATGPTGPTGTVDSATTIALIDSAYVQARTTAGTDSAATISLIGTTVDSAYVQTRQIKYTNNDFADSAFVTTQINSVIDAAPGALDTLNELAAALGDDANFSTTITNQIAAKLDSAQAIAIIDSAYVQARTTAGTDSATVISLIDSSYVSARAFLSIDSDLTIVYPEQIIHSFSKTTYSTVKYIAQLKVASGYHAEELLLTHNGTNIAITSYAKLLLDSDLGIFDAQINGSNVELTLTPTKANTNVKLKAIPIAP